MLPPNDGEAMAPKPYGVAVGRERSRSAGKPDSGELSTHRTLGRDRTISWCSKELLTPQTSAPPAIGKGQNGRLAMVEREDRNKRWLMVKT